MTSLFRAPLFAMLLVAFMAVNAIAKSSHRPGIGSLKKRDDSETCFQRRPPLNSQAYEERCGTDSDPKHPCFTHWWLGLNNVEVCYGSKQLDQEQMYIKDGDLNDFAMKDPKDTFTIKYPEAGGATFHYSDYDPDTGCYTASLSVDDNHGTWRIWVSDEDGNDRDADTKHHNPTSVRICTKWTHIHVKQDG